MPIRVQVSTDLWELTVYPYLEGKRCNRKRMGQWWCRAAWAERIWNLASSACAPGTAARISRRLAGD